MGLLKKITRPISKFLDKIVPNELKPALPYLSAFAPFMLGPGVGAGSSQGLMALLRRGALTGGINLASQLAQEGSEGEFDPLSLALASGMGAMTSAEAPGVFRGMQRGTTLPGTKDTGIMSSIKHGIGKGGETAANWLGTQGEILRPDGEELTMKNALTAGSVPITQGTGDLARITAEQALRDYENEMAGAPDAITGGVTDEGRRRAIRAAMEAGGHAEETILDALAALGLKQGGIVGLKHGGRIGYRERGFVDPNDYPQQEDVSILELQQGEGVPIGPMVQEDRQKQLLKAFAQYQAGGGKLSLKEFAVMWMRENAAGGGRINKEGGGVASVLPKGTEADYRGGGVIPVGSRERADDVPARLSKNEFVMTADAVKAAGGGSVNRGAKKMYNLMHNLEARV